MNWIRKNLPLEWWTTMIVSATCPVVAFLGSADCAYGATTDVTVDIKSAPFSYRGSALAITGHVRNNGVMLQDVSGNIPGGGKLFEIKLVRDETTIRPDAIGRPEALTFFLDRAPVAEVCFQNAEIVRFRGREVAIKLVAQKDVQIHAESDQTFLVEQKRIPQGKVSYRLTSLKGTVVSQTGSVPALTLQPDATGEYEAQFEIVCHTKKNLVKSPSFDDCLVSAKLDFKNWLGKIPTVPDRYQQARGLAAYVLWSAVLNPAGNLKRPAVLMSKNWMNAVWSWDHCFNAMALAYAMPTTAWDQFMVVFDQQAQSGQVPDLIQPGTIRMDFLKPPIHGWAFRQMMSHVHFDERQLREAYAVMTSATKFWLEQRDSNKNGIPEYNHGDDSGWDNGTEFDVDGEPGKMGRRESANLCAFLILQMDLLHDLALRFGKSDEATAWQHKADDLLRRMLTECWTGEKFVTRRVDTGEWTQKSQSLMAFLPIVLGEKLPAEIRKRLIEGLKTNGYLTPWGLATERVQSSLYQADGYWRGPIWAPSTLLIVDGLSRSGEQVFAKDIARRFCELCSRNGFAENFDAQTGRGLRDPAYTWTASVFLILAHDYL